MLCRWLGLLCHVFVFDCSVFDFQLCVDDFSIVHCGYCRLVSVVHFSSCRCALRLIPSSFRCSLHFFRCSLRLIPLAFLCSFLVFPLAWLCSLRIFPLLIAVLVVGFHFSDGFHCTLRIFLFSCLCFMMLSIAYCVFICWILILVPSDCASFRIFLGLGTPVIYLLSHLCRSHWSSILWRGYREGSLFFLRMYVLVAFITFSACILSRGRNRIY